MTLLQQHQGVSAKLVGELLLNLEDLSGPGIVPKRPGHLLVGHRSLVPLSLPPECRHLVLIPGGKAENAGSGWHPGQTVGHVWVFQHLKKEVKESHPFTCSHYANSKWGSRWI